MSDNKVTFKTMLKEKQFRKFFIATIISRFGDSIDMIAYAFMVYQLTGSPALMAVLFAVNGIPSFILNMVTGVAVAYMQKKKVVYISDALRGVVVLFTAILYFNGGLEVWHLYVFTILNSTLEAFRAPSASVLFRLLVSDEHIEHATSLYSSGRMFAELIGYASAGIIIGIIGVGGAIVIDAVTFFLSAFIILLIKMDKEVLSETKLTIKQYVVDFTEGFRYVAKSPLIRSLALFMGGISFLFAPFNALQAAYVLETLSLDAMGISVMSVSFMVAMIIGSLMVPTVTKKIGSRFTFILGGVVVGTGYFLFALIAPFKGEFIAYVLLAVISVVMGSTVSFVNIPVQVALFKKVDKSLLARVISFISMLSLASIPIGGAIVGGLVKIYKIETLFYAFGIGVVVLFLMQLFNKAFRELDLTLPTNE